MLFWVHYLMSQLFHLNTYLTLPEWRTFWMAVWFTLRFHMESKSFSSVRSKLILAFGMLEIISLVKKKKRKKKEKVKHHPSKWWSQCSRHLSNGNNMWNLLKVNNKDTRKALIICSVVFIVNLEQIPQIFLVFLLLSLNK